MPLCLFADARHPFISLTAANDPVPRPADWTLADVVDFEHFLAAPDADATGVGDPATQERRDVFRAWVDVQRERHARGLTPGERLRRGESMLSALAWLLGLVFGATLAGAWLAQGVREPVNAPLFWAATVGVQLLLLALAAAGWLWRRSFGARVAHAGGGLHGVLQALIAGAGGLLRRLPGERRDALRAALGRLALRRATYGALLAAPAVAVAQRFGVAFNVGLLFAMLALHLPLVDLRFGWQSTYPISAEQMHRAVHWVATPWRWALPQAQPTADNVAATRYGRGQEAHTLPADAARAWWPFLVLSVACYGLLVRAALLLFAKLAHRRALARLRFDHPEANALWRRLAGPLVSAEGGRARLPELAHASAATSRHVTGACVALVAQELALDDDELRAALRQRFGWQLLAVHRVAIDDRTATATQMAELAALHPRPAALVVVAPASREPIVAVALFLRAAVDAAGPGTEVLVLLTAADAERLAIWQRFVQIQSLRVGVEAIG
jgi:hypothetical protein